MREYLFVLGVVFAFSACVAVYFSAWVFAVLTGLLAIGAWLDGVADAIRCKSCQIPEGKR